MISRLIAPVVELKSVAELVPAATFARNIGGLCQIYLYGFTVSAKVVQKPTDKKKTIAAALGMFRGGVVD